MNDTTARIEERIDRQIGGAIALHAAPGNMITIAPTNMAELFEFAKMMAVADSCIRPIFRNKPGACLAVALQAFRTGADPFAVANKAYLVNDQIAYEAQYIHAVINTSGQLKRRLRPTYEGEGPNRRCKIVGEIIGEEEPFEYVTPAFSAIPVKNSPLWKNDPDQQLFYYASRAWARRYLPEVILGMDTGGDIESQMRDVTPPPRPTHERAVEPEVDEPTAQDWQDENDMMGDVPLYDVVDCDGESALCTTNTVADNMLEVFAEAHRRGMQAVEAAIENNEATVNALSDAGEHEIAGPLLIELAQLRGLVAQSEQNATPEAISAATPQNPAARPQVRSPAADPPRAAPPPGQGADNSAAPSQPSASPESASLVVPPFNVGGPDAARAWWLGRFMDRLRRAKTPGEIDELCAVNGETIQGYYATLTPAGGIAARKEIDDAKKALSTPAR